MKASRIEQNLKKGQGQGASLDKHNHMFEDVDVDSEEFFKPPHYDCKQVNDYRAKHSEFDYKRGDRHNLDARERRPMTELENGARYQGEWLAGTDT